MFSPNYRSLLKAKIFETGHRTVTEFAEKVGVHISRISRIISGWEHPSASLAEKMAEVLGVSLEDFKELL